MRKIVIIFTIASLVIIGAVEVIAVNQQNDIAQEYKDNIVPLPSGNGLMQRLRNRICDTFGLCQGGVNLTAITEMLTYDSENFYLGDVELHFGPVWFIESAESNVDYDNDGTKELVFEELQGLVGTEITVEGHMQSSGWMSVFTINGEIYREPGQPIWASPHQQRWRNRHGPRDP